MKQQSHTSRLASYSKNRLEALTDGIFAIAMTILVLDLHIDSTAIIASSQDLWSALVDLQSEIITMAISFLILGSMWAVHMRQFESITRVDRHMTAMNTVRLLFVVLVPFATSVATDYPDILLARVFLPLVFLAIILIGYLQWSYAVSSKREYAQGLDERDISHARARNYAIITTSAVIVVLSIFIGEIAFIAFLFSGLLTRLFERFPLRY